MPPRAANTAKPRTSGVSASRNVDTDDEYMAYYNQLKEAESARTRLKKATKDRDENRAALKEAYELTMAEVEGHAQRSMSQYKVIKSIANKKQLARYKQALDRRDQKLHEIVKKLVDFRQIMTNHCVQLQALYESRVADMNEILRQDVKESGGVKSKTDGAGEVTNTVEDQPSPASQALTRTRDTPSIIESRHSLP